MKSIVLLVVVGALILVEGRAQEPGTSPDTVRTYRLPEVVVTATRTERDPLTVGRSVSVLFGDEVKRSVYHSVAEAISQKEGLYIVGTGQNFGAQQSLFLRGAGSHQTAVVVDDVRITDPSGVNNALDLSELLPFGFDRIEIVRGSHSTLYGSSAVGGVVNLISRKQWTPGLHADANIWTGTFGSGTSLLGQQLFFNATAASGLYANFEAVNSRVRGLDATVDTVSQMSAFKNRDKDGMVALDLFGKVGFANRDVDAYVAFKRHRQEKDIDKAAYRDDDNATLDFSRHLLTYGASYRFSDRLRLKFVGGYSEMKRTAVDDSSVVDASGKTDQTYSRNAWSGTMGTHEVQAIVHDPHFEVVLGGGVYAETMSSQSYFFSNSIFGPFEFSTNLDTLGLKATVKHLFGRFDVNGGLLHSALQKWNLGFGARLTHHNAFGYHRSLELNPSYRVSERGLVYASYSMGFSAPSLYQLYAPDRDFSSGITRGNNGLRPESSSSYELGMKLDLSDDVGMTASYFHTLVNNSIEYVYLWDHNIPIEMLGSDFRRNDFRGDTYLNLGRQTTDGFEFTIHARLNDVWSLSGNLSLVSGKLRYDPNNLDQQKTQGHYVQLYSNGAFLTRAVETAELVRRPNTANLVVTFHPTEEFMSRLAFRHVGTRPDVYYDAQRGPYGALGTQPVDAYTVVDLVQHYAMSKRLSISARVENVFNTKYLEINGFTTRGRGFFVSARYLLSHQF